MLKICFKNLEQIAQRQNDAAVFLSAIKETADNLEDKKMECAKLATDNGCLINNVNDYAFVFFR
jgi:hypothetical protein